MVSSSWSKDRFAGGMASSGGGGELEGERSEDDGDKGRCVRIRDAVDEEESSIMAKASVASKTAIRTEMQRISTKSSRNSSMC